MNEKPIQEAEQYFNQKIQSVNDPELTFKIHYWGMNPRHFDNPLHKHSFYEVCYILGGKGSYIDNYKEFTLSKDVLFLSRPGLLHQIRSLSGLSIWYIAFEVDRSKSNQQAMKSYDQLIKTEQFFKSDAGHSPTILIWKSLLKLVSHQHQLPERTLHSLTHALLSSFQSTFISERENTPELSLDPHSSTLLHRAKLYIQDNLASPLQLTEVAAYLHISGRHLSRIFTNEMNQNYTDYIREIRVQNAERLLKTTNISIKKIAELCGFSSVHYFTNVFHHKKSITPGQYRKVSCRIKSSNPSISSINSVME